MIITPERLLDLARDHVEERAAGERVRCAFAVGSVVHGEPLLGGAADVDVVIIHKRPPSRQREIVRLSRDVHLDLFNYDDEAFDSPRALRVDPDLGPAIEAAVRLYDPEHFFDWLQAGVRAQFHRPGRTLERAKARLTRARAVQQSLGSGSEEWPHALVRAACDAANAAAALGAPPAGGRRMLLQLRQRLNDLGRTDLLAGLLELIGAQASDSWNLPQWLSGWAKAYDRSIGGRGAPPRAEVRRDYYLRGFQALAEAEQPQAVLLQLLMSWPCDGDEPDAAAEPDRGAWEDLLHTAGLQPERTEQKARQLESYLDEVELFLESWGEEHGA